MSRTKQHTGREREGTPARGAPQHSCVSVPGQGPHAGGRAGTQGLPSFPTALQKQHLESPLFHSQLPPLSPLCTHYSMHSYLMACGPEPDPPTHTYSDGEASCQSGSCSRTSPLEGAPPSGHLGSLPGLTAPPSLSLHPPHTSLCIKSAFSVGRGPRSLPHHPQHLSHGSGPGRLPVRGQEPNVRLGSWPVLTNCVATATASSSLDLNGRAWFPGLCVHFIIYNVFGFHLQPSPPARPPRGSTERTSNEQESIKPPGLQLSPGGRRSNGGIRGFS